MAKLTIGKGLDKYITQLEKLDRNTPEILGRAIYPAAGLVANAVKANIEKIPVSNSSKRGTASDPISTITSSQKQGLRDGFGISKIRNDGGLYNVKLGFAGYNTTVSTTAKRSGWTHTRQANQMIARAVENGTSFRKKHPFIAPAIRSTRKPAEKMIADALDEEIAKAME